MSTDTEWKVLQHDALEQVADNLWRVEGALPSGPIRRCMVVARLQNGQLVIHNGLALDEAGMEALEALGEPAFLVVPNGWHRLDAARYVARYPNLKVICPKGAQKRVSKKVSVHAHYGDCPQPDPNDDTVRFEHVPGLGNFEGAMLVKSGSETTLVMNDALFNLEHQKGFFWWVYGRLLGATGGPRVTLIGRLFLVKKKAAYGAWLLEMSKLEGLRRVLVAHGDPIDENAGQVLEQVAATLGPIPSALPAGEQN